MNASILKQPTVVRIWRGRTCATAPMRMKLTTTKLASSRFTKALGIQTFREDREHETEFMTISYWENVEAMRQFTGDDPTQVHHLERDAEFLLELPKAVQILRLLTSHGVIGSPS